MTDNQDTTKATTSSQPEISQKPTPTVAAAAVQAPPQNYYMRQQKRPRRALPWIITSIVLAVLLVGGLSAGGVYFVLSNQEKTSEVTYDGNTVSSVSETTISDVIEKVSPSVVSIVTNTTTQTIYGAAQAQAAARKVPCRMPRPGVAAPGRSSPT